MNNSYFRKADNWPSRLLMQLMPKTLIGSVGGQYLKDSNSVMFHPQQCEALDILSNSMGTLAGVVHFQGSPPCDIKILILLYTPEKKSFLGFIPNQQHAFVDRLKKVIQQKQEQVCLIVRLVVS